MTRSSLTYDMVKEAILEIQKAGDKPSVRRIRDITNTGSHKTISELLDQVMENLRLEAEEAERAKADDLLDQYPVPDNLSKLLSGLSAKLQEIPLLYAESAAAARADIIREDDRRRTATMADHQKALDAMEADFRQQASELLEANANKGAQIADLTEQIQSLSEDLTTAKYRTDLAETKLSETEERIRQLTTALTEQDETRKTLNRLLELNKNLPPSTLPAAAE
ncbi:MAG: DNA-binding protein [Alphaproteobacteria bacterium]